MVQNKCRMTTIKKLAPGSSIEEQKIEHTKKYASDQEVEWWGNFFNHQHTILVNHLVSYRPPEIQFQWSIGAPSMVTTTNVQSLDNPDLNNLVRARQRDICGTKNITCCRGEMARQSA